MCKGCALLCELAFGVELGIVPGSNEAAMALIKKLVNRGDWILFLNEIKAVCFLAHAVYVSQLIQWQTFTISQLDFEIQGETYLDLRTLQTDVFF